MYNLSARTHKLVDLGPGQVYNVWIRAVNAAGPGENATTRFTAKEREDYGTKLCQTFFFLSIRRLGVFAFIHAHLCFWWVVHSCVLTHLSLFLADMPVTSITSSIFIIFIICVLGFL